MEESTVLSGSGQEPVKKVDVLERPSSVKSMDSTERKVLKTTKPTISPTSKVLAPTGSIKKKAEPRSSSDLGSNVAKPAGSSSSRTSVSSAVRRNSTGGVPEKQPVSAVKRLSVATSITGKKTGAVLEPVRQSLPEHRRSPLPSVAAKPVTRTGVSEARKSVTLSSMDKSLRSSTGSGISKPESVKKTSLGASLSPSSSSSSRRVSSQSMDSTGSSVTRKSISKVSSPSARSPGGLRSGSLSASLDRSSNLSGRRRTGTPESRDSRFIVLPQVEIKASDDVRLDLRGHRISSLNAGLNLLPNLEFVYLRDNLLSTVERIEILKRVKVLDLSFNEFKGPGFEPLENCKALQQLYLAGNQITSLGSLPQLPNLEFLSVAENKLKSLSMASQPCLQVLAASKNKITTLKGFPNLPVLEENPILKMPHVEAAAILLVGHTLKKFNDRDISREEVAFAKGYPACAAMCIRDDWELCRPENAVDMHMINVITVSDYFVN